MEKRIYIDKEIQFQSEDDDPSQAKVFYITKKLSEGGSVICYEGHFKSSTNGILREFYPRKMAAFLERNSKNQLLIREEDTTTRNLFCEQRDNYLRPYYMLREKCSANPELATFLPSFEIYFGAGSEENSLKTAYIWTPEQSVETFKVLCEKIHKRPKYKPETKLLIVLKAIRSLTQCIRLMHSGGFIHRDIKPSNFGFKKRNKEILPETISLFDINTICSVYEEPEFFAVSQGYTEPEFTFESANNLTDIYSIGATLFSAIIVSEDRPRDDYTYHDEDYDNLKYLVDNSELIKGSEINSAPLLRATLTEILQNTLCRRENRFENCEKLLEKIDEAYFYLMPNEISGKSRNAEKWVLKEVEKSFDKAKEKNVLTAIQYHLYEHPLYKKLPVAEKNLHVLICGFGNYGQKFLDVCLQVGQMVDVNFSATVVSKNSSDKEIYLNDRPALKDFFDVDDDKATCGQSYGKISFKVATIAKNETVANSDAVDDVILELCEKAKPHYVFIALGNDTLNKSAAFACRNALKSLEINCLVNFAQEENLNAKSQGIMPVYVRRDVKTLPVHSEIERMAFNAHLVWEKNLNFDYNAVRKNFLEPYNHDACVANVLSIKYKLHSIGIDIKKNGDLAEAAKIFVEKNLHRDGKKNTPEYNLRNQIIFVEHKRWVVEKICAGYKKRNLEDCADGTTKDKKRRNHACILTSCPNRFLHDNYQAEDWDTMSQQELKNLDELDKMSVQLHQKFRRQIGDKKSHLIILLNRAMEDIVAEISRNMACSAAFSELKVCLQSILNGDKNKIRLYENLKSVFEKSLSALDSMSRENIKKLLGELENKFQPFLNAMEYRDYKQDDVALIDNIPFILTYSTEITLVIPYNIGNNTEVFCNVASATVVNPAQIIYLALFEKGNDVNQLKKSLDGLIKYVNRKNLRADIEFAIAFKASSSDCSQLEAKIAKFGIKRIRRVKVFPFNMKNKVEPFKNYLNRKAKSNSSLLIEKNGTYLSGFLEGQGIYNEFAAYEFNSLNMKFNSFARCEFLNYINKKNFITANDLTELNSSKGRLGEQPTFFEDYKALWKKYRENPFIWKTLCNLLDEHSQKVDVLVKLERPSTYSKTAPAREYTYLLPSECLRTVEDNLLKVLKSQKFIEDYAITIGSANSFAVTIKDSFNNESAYRTLFANPYTLFQPEAIRLIPKNNSLSIVFDGLIVKDLDLSLKDRKVINLLEFFAAKNYLTNLNVGNLSRISFTYATRTIKNLLTVAGKILEIYVWHEIKSSSYFDDVVSNFELNWNSTEVKNEIDCIAIKKFKVLIIECKARQNIEQDFHHKLSAISEHFGINCTPVLIADTQKLNENQGERGIVMQITTVWQKDEIENIGATLRKIVNGNYQTHIISTF